MNNKRIDLTQFEGMTKGEWVYHEGEDRFMGKTAELHIPHPALDNEIHRIDGEPATAIIRTPIEDAWPKKEDIKAMSLIPDLIAELKRCYEEIDRVRSIAEDLHAYIVSDADISLSIAEKQMDWVEASE